MELSCSEMKYVLDHNTLKFVIFPGSMNHSDIKGNWTNAGMLYFNTSGRNMYGETALEVSCYGESVSLKLESNPRDATIINCALRATIY